MRIKLIKFREAAKKVPLLMARPLRPYPYREGENNEGKVGTGIENLYVFDFYSVGALLSYFVRRSVIFFTFVADLCSCVAVFCIYYVIKSLLFVLAVSIL